MKSYTDLEQSKKLAEILPLESADMWWAERYRGHTTMDYQYVVDDTPYYYLSLTKPSNDNYSLDRIKDIPCWSLAALLGLMPKTESLTIDLCLGGSNGMEHTFDWFCTCDENEEPYDYKTFHSDNPIDCTFEMICWLKANDKL